MQKQITRSSQGSRRGGAGSAFPQQLQASVQIDKVIRFSATAALSAAPVTATDLLNMMCVATSTTAAYRLPQAVRLRKIEAWAPPASTGASVTLSLEDQSVGSGGFVAPSRIVEDVTMGISRPAHIVWTPRVDSLLSKWLDDSGNLTTLFVLTGPSGSTFDVHLSFVLQDGETPTAVGTLVAATLGQLYFRSLNSTGGNNIPPVSYTTI